MSTQEATLQQPLLQAIEPEKTLSGEERHVRAGTSG